MEDFHCLLALGELGVLGEEVVELDDALELDSSSLELREVLIDAQDFAGCAWLWLDLNFGGHVVPQVLELHRVVVLGIVPRHLVHLDVDTHAPPLHVGVVIAVLVQAQKPSWV